MIVVAGLNGHLTESRFHSPPPCAGKPWSHTVSADGGAPEEVNQRGSGTNVGPTGRWMATRCFSETGHLTEGVRSDAIHLLNLKTKQLATSATLKGLGIPGSRRLHLHCRSCKTNHLMLLE